MSVRTPFVRMLERLAGEEEIFFVIPYTFLPPRYLKESRSRNLLICVDLDMVISTRWEGAKMNNGNFITPRAAYRLIMDALARMRKYSRDSFGMAAFLTEHGCVSDVPTEVDDPSSRRPDEPPPLKGEINKESAMAGITATVNGRSLGGESPMPAEWMMFDG